MLKKNILSKTKVVLLLSFLIIGGLLVLGHDEKNRLIVSPFPDGKNFAFTITADPDGSNLEENIIIYDFITEIGMRTTIAVWVKGAKERQGSPEIIKDLEGGDSCERPEYLQYMQELQERGFEIALHTVTAGNDIRNDTIEGYEKFKEYFGSYPEINIMHSTNLENVYWGKKVVNSILARALVSVSAGRSNLPFSGEDPKSQYFWGDILKEKTKYIRLWGTSDINTLKMNPSMPYHDPKKPFVNYWFSFSDGWTVDIFNDLISDKNINKLAAERGACIVYTHFASNFVMNGTLNEIFKKRMKNIARRKDGWFVPASELLDRLLLMKKVKIEGFEHGYIITNYNNRPAKGVTILLTAGDTLYDSGGLEVKPNEEGEIIIEMLLPGETQTFLHKKKYLKSLKEDPSIFEKLNMFIQRSLIYMKHN